MPAMTPNPITASPRDEHAVRTVIPAKHGRPSTKPPKGRYRRLMKTRFDHDAYRRRSQVETVMSMIKRRQGAHVHGRTYYSQCRDLRLLALTHNVMILKRNKVFYRARMSPFRPLRGCRRITANIAAQSTMHAK
jgi:hypothetical protein